MRYLSALLVLVLVLTGQSMAIARGAAPVAGQAELCNGHLIRIVLIDADGQPTEAGHICPDCAFGIFDTVAAGVGKSVDLHPSWTVGTLDLIEPVWRKESLNVVARGPPNSVRHSHSQSYTIGFIL